MDLEHCLQECTIAWENPHQKCQKSVFHGSDKMRIPVFDFRKAVCLDIPSVLNDIQWHVLIPVVESALREVADVHHADPLNEVLKLMIDKQARLENFLLVESAVLRVGSLAWSIVPVDSQVAVSGAIKRLDNYLRPITNGRGRDKTHSFFL